MIMDGLDTLSQVALTGDVSSFCFDTALLTGAGRHASESLEDALNTPVTTGSDTSFFGPDALDPPPIIATGRCWFLYALWVDVQGLLVCQKQPKLDCGSHDCAVRSAECMECVRVLGCVRHRGRLAAGVRHGCRIFPHSRSFKSLSTTFLPIFAVLPSALKLND